MSQYFHTKTDQILRFATRKERYLNCSCLEKQTNKQQPSPQEIKTKTTKTRTVYYLSLIHI